MNPHYEQPKIQGFLDKELPEDEQQTVGEHLINCRRCRDLHDELREGLKLASKLAPEDAPAPVWNRVKAGIAHPDRERHVHSSYLKHLLAFGVAVIAMLLFVPVYLMLRAPSGGEVAGNGSGNGVMQVEKLEGAPKISDEGNSMSLAVGETLETDSSSSARIKVADIGRVDVSPNSKIKLLKTGKEEHRLELERGKLTADITAPPRLFIVDTPTATAVDLGCAYTLEVGDDGSSRLNVTSGYVALESDDRESFVPAGAFCETRKGKRMGTPFFTSASENFRRSLEEFDFGTRPEAEISELVSEARRKDTLTLWHLLYKIPGERRLEVFTRISQLVDLDPGITAEGVIGLKSKTMEALKEDLMPVWYEQPGWYK